MWLKQRRIEVGINSLEELARLFQIEGYQITPSALSHYENKRRVIPLDDDQFRNVAMSILRLSEHEILRIAGYKVISEHSTDGEKAAWIVDQLPQEKRSMAIRVLEAMLN